MLPSSGDLYSDFTSQNNVLVFEWLLKEKESIWDVIRSLEILGLKNKSVFIKM